MLTLRLISIVPCMTKLLNFDYCFKSCFLSSRYSACGFVYENISVYMYLFQTQLPSQITILRPESQKVTQILILVDCSKHYFILIKSYLRPHLHAHSNVLKIISKRSKTYLPYFLSCSIVRLSSL